MKRHLQLYNIILSVSLLTAGCTDHDFLSDSSALGSRDEVKLQSYINQSSGSRVNDDGFTDGDAIGVYIVDYSDGCAQPLSEYDNHANNVKFTYDEASSSWSGASTIYWIDNETAVDAYSYYPYTTQIEDVNAYQFKVHTYQGKEVGNTSVTGYEASDFLWAKAEATMPGHTIQLMHNHIMAGIRITLLEGNAFSGAWENLDKSVIITNTHTGATIDLSNGTVKASGDMAALYPYKKNDNWRAVVVPQTIAAGDNIITITVDGEGYNFKRQETLSFESGKLYNFTFRVDKRAPGDFKFTLVDESITAWETDDLSHNGSTKVYTVINIPYPGGFEEAVSKSQITPTKVDNLKLTGFMNQTDVDYLKKDFSHILALNIKEIKLSRMNIKLPWSDNPYTYGITSTGEPLDEHEDYCFDDALPDHFCSSWESNGLHKLQHVLLPDNLKIIGEYAFFGCPLSGTLELPDGLKWIGKWAFTSQERGLGMGWNNYEENHITNLIIPNSVEYIGRNAFSNSEMYYPRYGTPFRNELIIPTNIKYIGDYAFSNCTETYGTIHLPEDMKYLGDNAFYGVNLVGPVVFPVSLKNVSSAFSHTNITSVYIPEGITTLSESSFGGIDFVFGGDIFESELKGDIIIPNSVTSIGKGCFAGSKISHIKLPPLSVMNNQMLMNCNYLLDTITIPEGVYRINDGFLAGCSKLSAIVLPSTLEIIGGNDDYNDSFWWHIGAFENCFSLEYIRCDAVVPPTCISDPFNGVAKDNFTLVVPEQSVEEYQNAPYWSEFKRISAYRNLIFRPQKAKVLNKGGERSVILNADAGKTWTVTECPSWMHISKISGTGKTELKISIDAMSHGSSNRDGEIKVKLDDTDYVTTFHAYQYDYEYDEDQSCDIQNHSIGKGVPVVIVGDGYDAEDIATGKYIDDMRQSAEMLLDVEPYNTYRDYFDIYTAFALSYESGVGSLNYLRDTKFKVDMGDGYQRMTGDFDAAALYCIDNSPINEAESGNLTCIVVANSDIYDGVTTMYPNGLAVALCPKSSSAYPYDWRGLIQHEGGGHGFGKFADEYMYHNSFIQSCPCLCCEHVEGLLTMQAQGWGMNLSLSSRTEELPWKHQIRDWRLSDITDVWEGGFFHARGVFRPEYNTCMNNNIPYYSTWSREIIVRRIMQISGETFDYDSFVANDVRTWGKDFTLGSKATEPINLVAPIEGQAPLIVNRMPQRKSNLKH